MKPFELVNGTYLPKNDAIIFVDYEYWFYSYRNIYHSTPDLNAWFNDMLDRYNLVDVIFFGAFTQDDLKLEIPKIRSITNSIITTETAGKFNRKDTSDFIMLDFIYQQAFEFGNKIDYVLFTGDGHFHSIMKFLRFKLGATVLMCAVNGSASYQLRSAASEVIEYSADTSEIAQLCYGWIMENFKYIEQNPEKRIIPTFNSTVATVSSRYSVDENLIRSALQRLIDMGYLTRIEKNLDDRVIRILVPNWNLVRSGGPCE